MQRTGSRLLASLSKELLLLIKSKFYIPEAVYVLCLAIKIRNAAERGDADHCRSLQTNMELSQWKRLVTPEEGAVPVARLLWSAFERGNQNDRSL